jgi:signal transduction histidine kinase
MQAMPSGGDLAVTTNHNVDKGSVTACFCDTGVGVPADKFEEIFQPFVTTKTKGTGLGLSIVKRIVENHHGEIDLTSKLGEGTCFSITLPIQSDLDTALDQQVAGSADESIASSLPDQ